MFNEKDITEGLALKPARGVPATMGERSAIDWRVFMDTQSSMSAQSSLFDEYEKYLQDVEEVTGKRLPNPYTHGPRERPKMEQRVFDEVTELGREFPELKIRTPEAMRGDIGRDRAAQFQEQADIHGRTVDWPVSVAGFGATMGAAVLDPPVLASMLLGAPAASGILRGALFDARVGLAAEVPIQASVQFGRRQFGETPSLSEGVTNVLSAGAGGFLFSAFLRAGGKMAAPAMRSTRALLERSGVLPESPKVKAAREYLQRQVELEESSPLGDYPKAKEEHVARLSEATRAVMEGRAPDMPKRPVNPVRDVPGAEIPHQGAYDSAAELGTLARQAADLEQGERKAAEMAGDVLAKGPAAVKELFNALKAKPEHTEGLLSFLRRMGGIQDFEGDLKHLGLTARTRPGLLRKNGRTLDDATLMAWEAGYLPGENRPEINALLEGIRTELHGGKVVPLGQEAVSVETAGIDDLLEKLIDAGVDVRKMKLSEFGPALRELGESIVAKDAAEKIQRLRMGEAGKEATVVADGDQARMDAFNEQETARLYDGREDEIISFQNEDGSVTRQSYRDLSDELTGDLNDYEALTICTGRF